MASPLTKIPHSTRSVTAALYNNCWAVMHSDGATARRITRARTTKGQFQVFSLTLHCWRNVQPTDTIYQF